MNTLLRAIKPAVFVGSSRRDLQAFPAAVRREVGQALFEAQLGDRPAGAKPLKAFGSGVLEIRDNYDGDAYRAVYTVRLEGSTSSMCSRRNPPRGSPPRNGISI